MINHEVNRTIEIDASVPPASTIDRSINSLDEIDIDYWRAIIRDISQDTTPDDDDTPEYDPAVLALVQESQLDFLYEKIGAYFASPEYWLAENNPSLLLQVLDEHGQKSGNGFVCSYEGRLGICTVSHVLKAGAATNSGSLISAWVRNWGHISILLSKGTDSELLANGMSPLPIYNGVPDGLRFLPFSDDVLAQVEKTPSLVINKMGFTEATLAALNVSPLDVKIQTARGVIITAQVILDNGAPHLVASDNEICLGDSGSPVMYGDEIIGAVSGIYDVEEGSFCSDLAVGSFLQSNAIGK